MNEYNNKYTEILLLNCAFQGKKNLSLILSEERQELMSDHSEVTAPLSFDALIILMSP